MAKRTIDIDAKLLGLERTLEDDILDIMEGYVKDSIGKVTSNNIYDSQSYFDRKELDSYIRNIVYDVLKEVFGTTLIHSNNGKSFKQQLFYELESNGFVRDCPTCYWNTVKYGKIKAIPKE